MQTTASRILGKVIQVGLPVLCFLLALLFYLKTYDSCQIKITLVYIGGLSLIAFWIIRLIEERRLFSFTGKYAMVILPVACFLVSGISSYILSPFKGTSVFELLRRLIYIFTFCIVAFEFNTKKRVERLLLWILLGAFVTSLYGVVQYLGLDPFMWKGAFGTRIFSTFGNPNFFSAYLVLTAPIILAYVLLTRKFGYAFIFLVVSFCIIQAKSKAGWIGLAAGVLALTFLAVNFLLYSNKEKIKKIMIVFTILTILFSSFGVYYFIKKRVDSVRFRVFTWEATWRMIKHPTFVSPFQSRLLGTGIDTFKIVYPAYRMPEIFYIEGKHNTETDHPENEFLEIWYDEGIIGFGIFLWMILTLYWFGIYKIFYTARAFELVVRQNMNALQKEQLALKHYLAGVLAGATGLLVHNIMCVNMRFVSSGFTFWVILGLIVAIVLAFDKLGEEKASDAAKAKPSGNITGRKPMNLVFYLIILGMLGFFTFYFMRFYYADLYHNRGIAYSKVKNWDKAIKNYLEAVELNPNFIMPYYFLGNVFNDRWDNVKKYRPDWGDRNNVPRTDAQRALECYRQVKKRAPNYVQTHYQEGLLYSKLGMTDNAFKDFDKYEKLDPVYAYNYFQRAWIYSKQKEWDKSEAMFRKAIEMNPKMSGAYVNLGNMFYMKKDRDKAEKEYLEAIKVNPKEIIAYQNLIVIYRETGRLNEAREIAKKLIVIDPKNKYAKGVLGF